MKKGKKQVEKTGMRDMGKGRVREMGEKEGERGPGLTGKERMNERRRREWGKG